MHVLTMGCKNIVTRRLHNYCSGQKLNWKLQGQGINGKELILQVGGRVRSAEHRPVCHTDLITSMGSKTRNRWQYFWLWEDSTFSLKIYQD